MYLDSASKVAQILLDIEAVKIQPDEPFKWASGWNSPVYCDNRSTLSFPEHRTAIKHYFSEAIKQFFPDANCLVGVATAGVALGALVADELDIPYAYCRPKPKEHGLKNQLEGRIPEGARIVVVEDLISTGGSSLKVVEYLRNRGFNVLGLGAIFTYAFDQAVKNFEHAECAYFTLSDYPNLIKEAEVMGKVKESDIKRLNQWRESPETWK
jgi:orotate phosphoribosyltransferase